MQKPDWLKAATVYSLDFRSFYDGNDDGLGDIAGLISKFDYLVELGVNCIWLAPFYCSPRHDDGYDVVDYFRIDPQIGTMDDFRALVATAKAHDIRILLDLVVNHTSIDHPWFKKALEDPTSAYYEYYIWKKQKPEDDKDDLMFEGVEESNWDYEPSVSAYFYHTFYKHQPDLNVANPQVQNEILRILDFWMSTGIDGFRIDAVPHILRNKGDCHFKGDPYQLLEVWRSAVLKHNEHAVLIGEADVEPEEYRDFLNRGQLTGLFNFYINNYTFLALATEKGTPLVNAIRRLPLADGRRYLNFIRNHDELDLGRLTEEERHQVFERFAPEPSMIVYNRGIRRRLASMVHHNNRQMELTLSLLFSLPGIPVLRYGEEIGMGDDLNLPERKSVRTAMQWSDQRNGGFSEMPPQALKYPLIQEGPASYKRINVASQQADPTSLLQVTKKLIRLHEGNGHFFFDGSFELLDTNHSAILAFSYQIGSERLVTVHNFSRQGISAIIMLPHQTGARISVLVNSHQVTSSDGRLSLQLPGYGYSWFIVHDTIA
ncbi:maltose alpha-D-glucosyltransferase/ alpha-amylase [Parapedobacter composti]|uniref:Alpha-amylase n=1 Tax=Parapedobacter composti TaxID=623281 RepID=A0A1I1II65_9SPHI|nr:alpha-amylase family protein [Parapedobacter composti]SFC35956.1 maltose alpha-D-glucosyltransferase/ alpha-amylase [Parapedobacter composti]